MDDITKRLQGFNNLVKESKNTDIDDFLEKQFRLKGNPFPPSGVADAAGENPPLEAKTTETILQFIERVYRGNKAEFLVVRGDYGTGKTSILRFIEHVVETYMNKGDRAARAIYVERPRVEAQELNRTILRSLGFDTVRKYIWYAVKTVLLQELTEPSDILKGVKRKLLTPQVQGRGKKPVTRSFWSDDDSAQTAPFDDVFNAETMLDYRTFLTAFEDKGWNREDIRHYLIHLLLKATKEQGATELAQAFVALLLAPDEASFSSWETLVAMTDAKTANSFRAPRFLEFLLKIMDLNGIVYVYLLLDEFEEVSQGALLGPRQRQDYLYTVREVFNNIHEGLSIVIGISPAGWEALAKTSTPLSDIASETVELSGIQVDEVTKLIRYYFAHERGEQVSSATDIRPLSNELIRYIVEEFPEGIQQTPRNVIQFLYRLMNYITEQHKTQLATYEIQTLLDEFGSVKAVRPRQTRRRRSANDAADNAN